MKYTFELYITTEKLLPDYWTKLYKALLSYLGSLCKFEIIFKCTDNVVRFFISADKDLSTLSNNIEGLLLRPVEQTEIEIPKETKNEGFMQFVSGGNLLDLKEKTAVKKAKDLQLVKFRIRGVNLEKAITRANLYFISAGKTWSKSSKLMYFFPSKLLAIDFSVNTRYLKKTIPKYLDIEKSLHMLVSDNMNALFEVDTFPYFNHNYYLKLTDYEFDKHSFIIGASGSGKSKLISLFVDRLGSTALKNDYRVIVIDPHASLSNDFQHIQESKVINFNSETTQLFSGGSSDISAATELTATLFKSLMGDQFNTKIDRVLRFSLYVLFTAQNMSLDALKRFITDVDLRNQILEHVKEYVPTNIFQFFGADFNELRAQYYDSAISPLIAFVDEMQMQPVLVGEGELSLASTIENNFLTVFSLNKVSMGERVVKTVAGLLIQQIFLLVQAFAFRQKVILIIDEVSVVQNPALASILAEARKFNLSVVLTQQYFGQIEKDLRDAIFANVYNYYAFKVSEEDARALEGNLNINIPKEITEAEHKKGIKEQEIRVKMMTELHPRECLVRLMAGGKVNPAIKARTVDAPHSASPTKINEKSLRSYGQQPALPSKFIEDPTAQKTTVTEAPPQGKIEQTSINEAQLQSQQKRPTEPSTILEPNAATQPSFAGITAGIVQIEKVQPVVPFAAPKSGGLFNLSELLAEQSSSRHKVNKRKDTA